MSEGVKLAENKLSFELDWSFIKAMAERMSKNKSRYKPYNWKNPIDIEELKQALFRHVLEVMSDNFEDDGDKLGHLIAISLNSMFIRYQLLDKTPNEQFSESSKLEQIVNLSKDIGNDQLYGKLVRELVNG